MTPTKTAIRPEVARLQDNIETVLKGKSDVVKNALIGVLARGHLLFEDVPGVGKTTLAQLLARSINVPFSRIQFTSDMLPSDILGVTVYDQATKQFDFKSGPIFANVVLADELNRTTPKTQSALLEAMASAEVSVDKYTYSLPQPFMVIATQNPIEFHGTFPLPKSQMDRFIMRLHLGYPGIQEEMEVLREQRTVRFLDQVTAVTSAEDILQMQQAVDEVRMEEELLRYTVNIVSATRSSPTIVLGASTRGALALRRAAQAKAYYENRDYCVPDDVKAMVPHVLAHRIQLARTHESTADNFLHVEEQEALAQVLKEVEVPV